MYFILVNMANNQIEGHWDVTTAENVPPAPSGFQIEQVTSAQFATYLPTLSLANNQIALWQNNDIVVQAIILDLGTVRSEALAQLLTNMNQFILYQPNGAIRYDQDFTNSVFIFLFSGNTIQTPPIPSLMTWQLAVRAYYFQTVQSIASAATVDAVQAIDVSIESFESKYGQSGTVSPDPGITTQQLSGGSQETSKLFLSYLNEEGQSLLTHKDDCNDKI
jgi:hypothetical protein